MRSNLGKSYFSSPFPVDPIDSVHVHCSISSRIYNDKNEINRTDRTSFPESRYKSING